MAVQDKTIWTPSEEWVLKDFGGVKSYSAKDILSRTGHNIALYGVGGVGKTTTASSVRVSAHGHRLWVFNAEGNAHVLAHDPNIKITPVFEWAQIASVTMAAKEVKSGEDPGFDVVVFDNMSEIRAINMRDKYAKPGDEQIQHWRTNTADILTMTRIWRDLTRRAPVSVIFIAWEDVEKNDAGAVIAHRQMFNPALQKEFPGVVDNVGRITVESDMRTRKLSFVPYQSDCKLSVAHHEAGANIPLELYYTDQPVLADVFDTIIDGTPFPADKYKKPARQG